MLHFQLNGFVEKYHPSVVKIPEPEETEQQQQSGITKFLQEISSKRSNEKQTSDEPQVQGKRRMLGLFSVAI